MFLVYTRVVERSASVCIRYAQLNKFTLYHNIYNREINLCDYWTLSELDKTCWKKL